MSSPNTKWKLPLEVRIKLCSFPDRNKRVRLALYGISEDGTEWGLEVPLKKDSDTLYRTSYDSIEAVYGFLKAQGDFKESCS